MNNPTPPKPTTVQGDLANLPAIWWPYQSKRVWVTWRWVLVKGKWTKPPFRADGGGHASSTAPDTWATYEEAVAAVQAGRADGIGIAIKGLEGKEIIYDIDDCRDPVTGQISLWAQEIIDEANSYTEVTPSGTGVRVLGQGDAGNQHRKFNGVDGLEGGIEIYTAGQARYITITGLEVKGCWPMVSDTTDLTLKLLANNGRMRPAQEELGVPWDEDPPKYEPAPETPPPSERLQQTMKKDLLGLQPSLSERLDDLICDGVREGHRSEQFHHAVGIARRLGWTPESLERAMRRHPNGIANKYLVPHDRLEREISRCWGKVDAPEEAPEASTVQQYKAAEAAKPKTKIRTTTFIELISDVTPDEPDYIEPNFLGPGNFCLIAGPPKAQKSFLLTEMLVAAATGTSFLGGRYTVPRPLKVFYLQAEMNRKLLRKRARMMGIVMGEERKLLAENLVVTERFHMLLDEKGVKVAAETIREVFPDGPDIIAIDPLANLFDGESEDKAPEMMAFLNGRIDALRRAVNPNAAIIMVHHSAKKNSEDMNRDPFVAIRGSGALRGYYDTGVIIYRKSEEAPDRKIFIECRSGESPEPMTVRLQQDGRFEVVDTTSGGISRSMADVVLGEIREAWKAGKPLSTAIQTKREGRHVGRVMAMKHGLETGAVEQLVEQWLMNGVVAIEVVDKHTKAKGLKVIGTINAEV